MAVVGFAIQICEVSKVQTSNEFLFAFDGDYGWGVRVRRHLAHAEGVLYGMELGSVTLKINTQHTLEIHLRFGLYFD